jgi:uncharacterized membrane protein
MPNMKALDFAVTAICAALYFVVGYSTSFGFSLGGVAFWPAAFIPAVFAVLFGPWVGGTGAAIGIFIRDVLYHGDPLLSLIAGVPANFVVFFLIGYLTKTKLSRTKTITAFILGTVVVISGLLLPTVLLPAESIIVTSFSMQLAIIVFSVTMGVSAVLFVLISRRWPEFRSFGIAAVISQSIGAVMVALAVFGYSQLFFGTGQYFQSPVPTVFVPIVFVWTFVTEIPFVLLISPPLIKVGYLAFPFLRKRQQNQIKANP